MTTQTPMKRPVFTTKRRSSAPDPSAPLSPGEIVAVLLVGGCVAGRCSALSIASTIAIPQEYFGAATMRRVIEICTAMYEKWGGVDDGGASPEAWTMTLDGYLKRVEDGIECADYCHQYLTDWESAQKEQL